MVSIYSCHIIFLESVDIWISYPNLKDFHLVFHWVSKCSHVMWYAVVDWCARVYELLISVGDHFSTGESKGGWLLPMRKNHGNLTDHSLLYQEESSLCFREFKFASKESSLCFKRIKFASKE